MSAARMGGQKWADVDEDEDEIPTGKAGQAASGTTFETQADKDGIKTVIQYTERNGQTYKVTKKVKVTKLSSRTNGAILERKEMKKFGTAATNEPKHEAMLIVKSEETVKVEFSQKPAMQLATRDDVEEKFYEESLTVCEGLFKKKEAWAGKTTLGTETAAEPVGGNAAADAAPTPAAAGPTPGGANANEPGRYVPPSLRGKGGDGKGGGKDAQSAQAQQEASLRITNLSEDVKEGDLQDLFGQCGRLQRVYLAKDMQTFQSKGFAFITYYNREDAQKAINKLNGHGYDNLILQVSFAKPRA